MQNNKIVNSEKITHQVFIAIDDELFLPIGERVSLEYLSIKDDGVFKNRRSWEAFVRGNFLYDGDYFIDTLKETTIKKWCRDKSEYISKFATPIGKDKYLLINPDDIELSFSFEWYTSKNARDGFACTAVELFVTAEIK